MVDEPLAFFITWTVYGTFLQGDERGWRRRRHGEQLPQPLLAQWRKDRLRHSVELLTEENRVAVEAEIERLCRYRQWHLWARNARSNHVHIVVTAIGFDGPTVRDQVKANCTRVLRQADKRFDGRPVWTTGGDCESINDEDDLEQVILYVRDAQSSAVRWSGSAPGPNPQPTTNPTGR